MLQAMAAEEAGPSSGRRQSDQLQEMVHPAMQFPNLQQNQHHPSQAAQLAQLQAQYQAQQQQNKKRDSWNSGMHNPYPVRFARGPADDRTPSTPTCLIVPATCLANLKTSNRPYPIRYSSFTSTTRTIPCLSPVHLHLTLLYPSPDKRDLHLSPSTTTLRRSRRIRHRHRLYRLPHGPNESEMLRMQPGAS